jgi:hypothetical protein
MAPLDGDPTEELIDTDDIDAVDTVVSSSLSHPDLW